MNDSLLWKRVKVVIVGFILLVLVIGAALLVWQQYLSDLIVPFWSGK